MDISKNIIAIREAKRIKQVEVANALNIDAPNYSRLEKRNKDLSINQLESIAVALGVTVDDILHYGEEKPQIVDNEKVKELENRIKELESIVKDKVQLIELLNYKSNEEKLHPNIETSFYEAINRRILSIIGDILVYDWDLKKNVKKMYDLQNINKQENDAFYKFYNEVVLPVYNFLDRHSHLIKNVGKETILNKIETNIDLTVKKSHLILYYDEQTINLLASSISKEVTLLLRNSFDSLEKIDSKRRGK